MSTIPSAPVRYAGFWRRAIALGIDAFALAIAVWLAELALLGVLYWFDRVRGGGGPPPPDPFALQVFLTAAFVCAGLPYFTGFHAHCGATPGKRVLGVRVVSRSDHGPLTLRQALVRYFGFCATWLFPAAFLAAAVHPEKQCLHDRLAGTITVVQKGS